LNVVEGETVIEVPPGSDIDFVPPSQVPEGAGSFTGLVAGAGVLAATLHKAVKSIGVQLMEHLNTVSTGLTMLSALMSKESATVAALADSLDEMHEAISRLREQAGGTLDGIVELTSDGSQEEVPPPSPMPATDDVE